MKKTKVGFICGLIGVIVFGLFMANFNMILSNNFVKEKKAESYTEEELKLAYIGENAIIYASNVESRITGTAPFDENDEQGNDSSATNDIIRSYDTITYNLENSLVLKQGATENGYSGGIVEIEAQIPKEIAKYVRWDFNVMTWAVDTANVSEDGSVFTARYAISDKQGINIPGKISFPFALKVLGAPNGLEIKPTFKLNLLGNEENEKIVTTTFDTPVKVSAAPKIDIGIDANNGYTINLNGETKRIYKHFIDFKLIGDSIEKELKGVEIPQGELSFDINYKMLKEYKDGTRIDDISNNLHLYNYKYNIADDRTPLGNPENSISDFPYSFLFSSGRTPWSFNTDDPRSTVYKNGNLTMEDDGKGKIHVTISDYGVSESFPDRSDSTIYSTEEDYSFEKNIGFISVGIFYMNIDVNEETISDEADFYLEYDIENINVEMVDGDICTEDIDKSNNHARTRYILNTEAEYATQMLFVERPWNTLGTAWGAGDARSFRNKELTIYNLINVDDNAEEDWMYAIDYLQKIDDKIFEPVLLEGKEYYTETTDWSKNGNVIYAAKKDKTGWQSHEEMIQTTMDDLIYFDTIIELKEQGYICVGMLGELQGSPIKSNNTIDVWFPIKIKSDAKVGYTGAVTADMRVYNEGNIPNRETQTHLKTNNKLDFPIYIRSYENQQYEKSVFNEDGSIVSGHYPGHYFGNSLQVIGAEQSVNIKVANVEDGNEKKNFNLAKNENDVIYEVQPVLSGEEEIDNVTLKLEVTLPKGMKFVVGSCKYGAPEINDKIEDGSSKLTWYMYDCTVNEVLDKIEFSAHIDDETPNNTNYEVAVVVSEAIKAGEDTKIGSTHIEKRTSKTSIKVINLANYYLYKLSNTPVIEKNDPMHYKITFINKTDGELPDFQLLDILPYNGDNRGTSFNGKYTLEKIDLNVINTTTGNEITSNTLKLFGTESEDVRNSNISAKDENLATTSEWNEIAPNEILNKEIKAIVAKGKLEARAKVEIDLYLRTYDNDIEDVYNNRASAQTSKNTDLVYTSVVSIKDIKRRIEGRVWLDKNVNGVIDGDEEFLEGITISLLNEDNTPVTFLNGEENVEVKTTTDSNGYYHFEGMDKGTYKVKVDISDTEYAITTKNVGSNIEINSKFEEDGITEVITNLSNADRPLLKESNVNAGLVYKETKVIVCNYDVDTGEKIIDDIEIIGRIKDEYVVKIPEQIPEYYELTETPQNMSGVMSQDIITVNCYYKLKNYNYEVNYLEKGTDKIIETKSVEEDIYGTEILVNSKVKDIKGYKFDSSNKDSLIIGTRDNIINIYYIVDESQTKELSYTVEYYKEGTKVDADTQIVKQTVQVLQPDTLKVDRTSINLVDKYVGYKLEKTEPSSIPDTINNGEVIKVYYIIDEDHTKELSYTVEYYKEGTKVDTDTQIVKQTVQVLEPDTLEVDKTTINVADKYFGYKLEKTEPSSILDTANNGEVIKVYYIIDEENTKDLSYTVEYYREGTKVDADTQIVKQTVQVLEPDTLTVDKTTINVADKYFGYKLEKTEPSSIPDTINNGEVIKVYYVIDEDNTKELSYTVEYYKEGTKVDSDTQTVKQTVQVLEPDTLKVDKTSINTVNKYVGYKLEKTEPSSIPDTVNNGDVIKVYYVKDEFNYTVEYYYDDVKDENKTEISKATYQDVIENYIDKNITGYKLEKTENLPLTISEKLEENIIKVYYVKDKFNYTVEYYYDNVKDESKTETAKVTYQDVIEDYIDKNIVGYKLDKTENLPLTVSENEPSNVIKIYYIVDDENTKELSYTVEYYKEGTKVEADTQIVKETVQVLQPDTLKVDKTSINTTDKYVGYKLEKTEPSSIPDTINNGDVIKVYYVIDEDNTKELSYTVEYYKEGTKIDADTQTVKETVQVLQPDTLKVDKTSINTVDKYVGYKIEKTEPSSIPDTINNGGVIKVYYVIDENNTKELSYTVEYYKEGTKIDADTQTVKETVQVLEADTLKVDKTSINLVDKYFGYKLEKTEPSSIPDTANNGEVIKVYYVIDEDNTKELSYTVEYYKEGTKVDADTQIVKQTVQVLEPDTLEVDKTSINLVDKYFGYKLEKTEPSSIQDTVNNGDVIKVYYVIDKDNTKELSYTVEYYKEGTKVDADTQIVKETVQVLQPDTLKVDKPSINITDKYVGYKLEKTEPSSIPDTVNNGDVIKVYYIIDEDNTKELSYTVEYYKAGTKVDADTQIVKQTVQVLEPDTLKVDKPSINITDKYVGYKLNKTEPSSIPDTVNNGEVIKVYYVIDEDNTKELSYTVEYYKEGTKVDSDTQTVKQTVQVLEPDTLKVDKTSINITDKYFGYKLEKTEPSSIPDTVNNEDVIKVYYVKDEFDYTVEYYYDKVKDDSKTETAKATYQEVIKDYIDKNITGYKLEKTENLPLTISEKREENIIKVYYVKDQFNYTVEYYYDNVKDESKTETAKVTYQDVIEDYIDKNIVGYKLDKTENLPLTVSENEPSNVIKIYYIVDDGNTKELSYKVEYYKEGTKVDADTQIVKTTVQVLEADTLKVDKTSINITDKYVGYKLEKTEPSSIPDTVNNGDVIKVYYIIDEDNTKELSYTVEYYKAGTKVDADTQIVKQTVQVLEPDTLKVDKPSINITDKYVGYKLNKTEPSSIPDTVNNGEVIKVYYVIDEDNTKELSYTVEYYKEGTKVDSDTQTVKQTVQVLEPDTLKVDKTSINITDKYFGYKLEKTEPSSIPDIANNGEVIKVYYVKDQFNYTVEYYYDNVKDESKTETAKVTYQDVIEDYIDKNIVGYKLDKTENLPLTVSENEPSNVIKIYYIVDDGNTKELSYKVEYYKEGTKVDADTQIVKTTVQVLEPDTLKVDKASINITDKYFGYKLEKTEPSSIPDTVNNGEVIKVYYIIDEDNTKELSYTVEYYKEGTKVEADTQIVKETVQVLEPDTLTVDKTSINTTDKYYGYKLEKTEPSSIPDTVNNSDVIKVYYIIDEDNTKELSYTVEYYKEGTKIDADTQTVKETVQVLQPDTLKVDKTSINTVDKYVGYKLDKTEPSNIPDTVNNGDVIKVYYVIDKDNTKELSYTVEYYKEGTKVEIDTQTVKEIVQVLEPDTLTVDKTLINTTDKYVGYKLEKTEPSSIPDTVSNGDVIKVYYVIDGDNTKELSYTVEYYKAGTKVDADTQTVKQTVQVLEPETLKVDKTSINITDKYFGYKLEKTEPSNIPDTVNNGDVIKVYYVIDKDNTKELSYTVEYYKEGTKVDADTQTVKQTVQVLEPDTLKVDKTSINTLDKYVGYKLEKTEPSNIPDTVSNGDVIKVYYVIDKDNTKELSYTVEYYKEGTKVEADTQVVKDTVQVLDADTLKVDKTSINTVDKYVGYKLEKTEPANIPDRVNNGDIIKIYYVRNQFKYIVEYYYDGVKAEANTEIGEATYQEEINNYIDKNIAGYMLEKTENLPLVITKNEAINVIKIYYTKSNYNYKINYYYDGIKDESKTQIKEAKYQEIINSYEDQEKEGFELEKVENLPLIIKENQDENVINVYYSRKNAQLIIKHIDKYTEKEIAEEDIIEGKIFDKFNISNKAKDIEGYTLVEIPEESSGSFTEEAQVKTFKYAINLEITVKYVDTEGNELAVEVIKGYEGKEYKANKKDFENYTFIESTDNTEGIMTIQPIEIVYYYSQNAKVIVNHIDKYTNQILSTVEKVGKVGDLYVTSAKDFEGYVLVERPQEQIIMGKETIVVNYYYQKISEGVIEKHIDIVTEEILDYQTYTGMEGTAYYTIPKEFKGYDLVEGKYPDNSEGVMGTEVIEVKYYYAKKASVKVEHIDKLSQTEIADPEYIYGHEKDNYTTVPKKMENYVVAEEMYPKNSKGQMKVTTSDDGRLETETVVKYYYKHKATVIEEHIDIKTEQPIDTKKHLGYEGDNYDLKPKEYEKYDLVMERMPNNSKGIMTKEEITVKYYYIRKIDVIVEYIDKVSGETIKEEKSNDLGTSSGEVNVYKDSTEYISGHEGDSYTTEQKIFDKYNLVEIPINAIGEMKPILNAEGKTETTIYVKYYYVHKSSGVIESHIDAIAEQKLVEDTHYQGQEGDTYETKAKTFEGYDIIETRLPVNATGKMTKELIEVKYYYVRKAKVIIEHIDKNTKEKISDDIIINGHEGEKYQTSGKNIEGYKLLDNTQNTEGMMTRGDIKVKYYYDKIIANKVEETNKPQVNNTNNKTPATGDALPVIAVGVIVSTIAINVIIFIVMRKKETLDK